MKFLCIPILMLLTFQISLSEVNQQDFYKKWERSGLTWEERWNNTLNSIDALSIEEKIDTLGRAARLNKYDYGRSNKSTKKIEYSRIAVENLVKIPGHADYFGKIVWDSYGKFKSGYDEGKGAFYRGVYLEKSSEGLSTLALLPSHETVRVLGPMLNEDWKWPDFDALEKSEGQQLTLDMRAAGALALLPLANPPSKHLQDVTSLRENVGAWRQWYSEIETGRRTFRFIGDETEYNLRGPVRRSAGMDSDRTGMRTKIATPGEEPMREESPTPMRFLPYLIGGLFLLAGLGVYLRGKRGNQSA